MKTSNLSSNLLIEENYFKNIQYSPVSNERPYFDQKIEKLLRENGDLVSSLQNAIDYMNSIKSI